MEIVLNNKMFILLILSSLLYSWETLAISFNNSAPNDVLSLGIVKDNLFNKETRRKNISSSNEHIIVIENRKIYEIEDYTLKEKVK